MKKIINYALATGLAATAIVTGFSTLAPLASPAQATQSSTPNLIQKPTLLRTAGKSYLNKQAPTFVVEKWLSPRPDIAGRFVLIDFWATWCPPCRDSIPHLNDLQNKFISKMSVVGVSDETEDKLRAFKNPKIYYYVAIDTQARMKRAYEVTGIPHAVLIDPKGIVRWEGHPMSLDPRIVSQIIAKYK